MTAVKDAPAEKLSLGQARAMVKLLRERDAKQRRALRRIVTYRPTTFAKAVQHYRNVAGEGLRS